MASKTQKLDLLVFILKNVTLILVVICCGCGGESVSGPKGPSSPHFKKDENKKNGSAGMDNQNKDEDYKILAGIISQELKPSIEEVLEFQKVSHVQQIAALHSKIRKLTKLENSSDKEVVYIANLAKTNLEKIVAQSNKISEMPANSSGIGDLFIGAGLIGAQFFDPTFISGTTGLGMLTKGWSSINNDNDAYGKELKILVSLLQNLDAAAYLLPRAAEANSAKLTDSSDKFKINIDESILRYTNDYLYIKNLGNELSNVTLEVELIGLKGESIKNIHFIEKWSANSEMRAIYSSGVDNPDGKTSVGKTSVLGIQKANVLILSSKLSTRINYNYQGKEKDDDIERYTQKMKLSLKYYPFVGGVIFDDKQGFYLKMEGFPYLGCDIDVTYNKNKESKREVHKGLLLSGKESAYLYMNNVKFDPSDIEVRLIIPGTSYQPLFKLNNIKNKEYISSEIIKP